MFGKWCQQEEVSTLVFLGMVVELVEDQLVMQQQPYCESKLKKRGLFGTQLWKGKSTRTKRRTLPAG
eukprot:4071713-Prorocentrum_lima.AAC.1